MPRAESANVPRTSGTLNRVIKKRTARSMIVRDEIKRIIDEEVEVGEEEEDLQVNFYNKMYKEYEESGAEPTCMGKCFN